MKQQELVKHHHMTIPELKLAVAQIEKNLIETTLKIRLGQEKNVHLAKNIRQEIAQIKTIIRHKELTGKSAVKESPIKIQPKSPKITKEKTSSTKKKEK